ncbi:MAG: polysaccharide deacetylase family protein [Vulcanimicrobiaceae bacterium]
MIETPATSVPDARRTNRTTRRIGPRVLRRLAATVGAATLALGLGGTDSSASPVARTASAGVPVLMYHLVDAVVPTDAVGHDLTVEPKAFEAQLRFLQAHHIRTLTASDLAAAIVRGEHPHDAVVLTFDDGYADAATTAFPLLRKYGERATFYISSGFVGTPRHVTWRQMREMHEAGMEIACHGTDHLDLSTLDRAGQLREAAGCKRRFAKWLGSPASDTYAYPAGKYDATTFAIMRELGMRAAFTERPGTVRDLVSPYDLPRRRVRHDDDLARFAELATP